MFKKFAPHRWISWLGLQIVCLLIFYIAFVVGIYSIYKGVGTFFSPIDTASAARRLYATALLQAALICLVTGTLTRVLKTFARLTRNNLTPKK